MVTAALIFILILAFVLRSIPRIILPYGIASDSYFHLYLTKSIIQHRMHCPKKDERFLLNTLCTYPYLHHYFLALFGQKKILTGERYSSQFYDTINTLLVFVLTNLSTSEFFLLNSAGLIPAFIYAISPVFFRFGDEPRVYNGSSRVMAQTIYLLHIAGLLLLQSNSIWTGSIIILITAAMIFNTTKFGIQVLLLFGIFFSVLNYWYGILVVGGFLLSVIISVGRTYKVLEIHIQHLIFLFKSKLYYRKFSPKTDLKKFLSTMNRQVSFLVKFNFRAFLNDFFLNLDPIHNLIVGFHVILLSTLTFSTQKNPVLFYFILGSLFAFLLTKLPRFRFLGKAERYLEFALAPAIILVFNRDWNSPLMIALLLLYIIFCICGIIIYELDFIKKYRGENDEFIKISEAFKLFNSTNTRGIVWTLNQHFHKPIFFTDFPILGYYAGTINKQKSTQKELDDMMQNYPYPSYDLMRIVEEYNIRYIITLKINLSNYLKLAQITDDFFEKHFEILNETDSLVFVKRK